MAEELQLDAVVLVMAAAWLQQGAFDLSKRRRTPAAERWCSARKLAGDRRNGNGNKQVVVLGASSSSPDESATAGEALRLCSAPLGGRRRRRRRRQLFSSWLLLAPVMAGQDGSSGSAMAHGERRLRAMAELQLVLRRREGGSPNAARRQDPRGGSGLLRGRAAATNRRGQRRVSLGRLRRARMAAALAQARRSGAAGARGSGVPFYRARRE
jgi:hypothetical protein